MQIELENSCQEEGVAVFCFEEDNLQKLNLHFSDCSSICLARNFLRASLETVGRSSKGEPRQSPTRPPRRQPRNLDMSGLIWCELAEDIGCFRWTQVELTKKRYKTSRTKRTSF